MVRLSRDERDIRSSAGIDVVRFWPFLLMFGSDLVASTNTPLFQRCLGNALAYPEHGYSGGRAVAAVRLILAIPCSVYRPGGDVPYWSSLALFALAAPFAIMQCLWMRRHRAYWDAVRKKEAIKRSEKRAQKAREPRQPS